HSSAVASARATARWCPLSPDSFEYYPQCECDNLVVHDRGSHARMGSYHCVVWKATIWRDINITAPKLQIGISSVSAFTSSASSPGGGCARTSSRGFGAVSLTSSCGGGSPQSFITAAIIKSHRFDIIQHFGCHPTTYISFPAILLV
ncbi:hypothetical protein K438DRAFT_2120106, partial [Mycena galopus ATCC 62051]